MNGDFRTQFWEFSRICFGKSHFGAEQQHQNDFLREHVCKEPRHQLHLDGVLLEHLYVEST